MEKEHLAVSSMISYATTELIENKLTNVSEIS
jgi:hypothetical protein